MHIPDGFLDTKTIVAASTFTVAGVARAVRNVTRQLTPQNIPLMGLAAAFIFVAQMLNFPVAGGTSGHLIGAGLAAVLLGPSAAIIVMTVVLAVQCILFADGGVLALGANVFNMGIVAVVCGYYFFKAGTKIIRGPYARIAVAGVAAWFSTVVAAICCTGELAWSGIVPWTVGFPAMAGIHMIIGIGEAIISTLILVAIVRTKPGLFDSTESGRRMLRGGALTEIIPYGIIVTLGLALFVAPFVTTWPDGLERVAETVGFNARLLTGASGHIPFADYKLPWVGSVPLATAFAAMIGAAVVYLISFLIGRTLLPKPKGSSS